MKLNLLSSSYAKDNDRYVLDHVFDGNIITNDDYQGLCLLDRSLKVIRNFIFRDKFLVTSYYLSDDRTRLLVYSEDGFLYYINLADPLLEPLTLFISEDVSLYPEYIWNEDRFIISDGEGRFFCYDTNLNTLRLASDLNDEQIKIFNTLNYYGSRGRLFFYDIKKNIFIYSIYHNNGFYSVFWKDVDRKLDVEILSPLIYIYRAESVKDIIFLINDESIVFFNRMQEVYRIDIKQDYRTFGARLFEYQGVCYFLLMTRHISRCNDIIIRLYSVK